MIELGKCSLCGHDFDLPGGEDRSWIVLNRYAVGHSGGKGMLMISTSDDDGDEAPWDVDDGQADLTGPLLCWPQCAVMWVEGQMVETTLHEAQED